MEAAAGEAEQKLERLNADIAQANKRLTALDRSAACLTFTGPCPEPCLYDSCFSPESDLHLYAGSSIATQSSACYAAQLLHCLLRAATLERLVAHCHRAPAPHAWLNLHSIAGLSWLSLASDLANKTKSEWAAAWPAQLVFHAACSQTALTIASAAQGS